MAKRMNIPAALIESATVYTGNSVAQGQGVILGATGTCTVATAVTDLVTHVAYATEDGVWPATAGDKIQIVRIGSPCIVPVLVGTGGATINTLAHAVADGATDATLGGATTTLYPVCRWCETEATVGALVSGWLGVSPAVGS